MNNGDDCEYYLAKGCRVVAIEADPRLCGAVAARFAPAIAAGSLTILNVGVGREFGRMPFYIHRGNSVLSTFLPKEERTGFTATRPESEFEALPVQVRRLSDIVRYFGPAEYIKIDIEGFDGVCLHDLDLNQIRPRYISAEAHDLDTFCHLVAMGYREYKMVAGGRVAAEFARHPIGLVDGGTASHGFRHDSSGPYGEDIPGEWVGKDAILERWLARGDGWFDLHARA